jgi:carboxymethylenebutenolidase
MRATPAINEVPVMIGGNGREEVYEFYAKYFLPQIPPDIEIVPVSRTIGQGRLVDEIVLRFTHTMRMDWILPSIPPTGKKVEVAFVVVVQFDGNKMVHEHLYWDQASVAAGLHASQSWCNWGSWKQEVCRLLGQRARDRCSIGTYV